MTRRFNLVIPGLLALCASVSAAESDKIRLIVRGDDFGYTHASNAAMVAAFEQGVMTSASVLVPGPWFTETAAILREHPEWSVGVHLTITSEWNRLRWRPVSAISEVPSLVAPDGYLWGFGYSRERPAGRPMDGAPWAEHAPNPAEVEKEFLAQIERAKALGVTPGYVDCHMGMACRDGLYEITAKLAAEYCLAISSGQMFGEKRFRPEYPEDNNPAGIRSALREALEAVTPELWLYVGHPAEGGPELRAVDSNDGERWNRRRSSVLAAWTDPEIRAVIERRGIELVAMRDLFDYSSCRPK